MIIHKGLIDEMLKTYNSKINGNGEIKNEDSLITLLQKPSLVNYRNTTVLPLSSSELKRKENSRIMELVNIYR